MNFHKANLSTSLILPRLPARVAYLLLALMMLGYLAFQGVVAHRLHAAFVTSADDLSNIDQVVWNSQHGRLLELTTGTRSVPRYGEHLEPIWIAMGVLYRFWDSVDALLFVQTVALAAGALPVFWLAADAWKGAGRRAYGAGLIFAAVYLLSPFVGRANSAEVHAMPFAVAPMLLAIYWAWKGHWKRVAPVVLLLLLVREDAGLLVAALGIWTWVARRAWHAGAALVAAGGVGIWLTTFVIIASFADARFGTGQEQSIFFERYQAFGEGPFGLLWGMLTRPDLWWALLKEPLRLAFLRELFTSTGGLVLFSPASWLLFLPHLMLNLLSDYFGQYGGLQHYGAPLVPGLLAAAILGGASVLRWGGNHPAVRTALLSLALGSALVTAYVAPWQPLSRSWIQPPVTAHHRMLEEIVDPIPPLAPLSADPQLHPHLAHRPDAYRFPVLGENTEWVIVDVTSNTTRHPADLRQDVQALLNENWGIVEARDGYLLLRRGAPRKILPAGFFTFGTRGDDPQFPLEARFGDLIEVLGYDVEQDLWGRVAIRWHLRPLAPLPPDLILDTALLGPDKLPLPDTSGQPLTLLHWLPPEEWVPGERYLVRTLPRETTPTYQPALTARIDGIPLPLVPSTTRSDTVAPIRVSQAGEWLTGGEWRLVNNHAVPGTEGWRSLEPPAEPAKRPGEWPVARLGAWQIDWDETAVTVTLHWQAVQQDVPPMQRFVHLVPAEGPAVPLAQDDGPLGGAYPISHWIPGEWVTETIQLSLPPGTPSEYRVLIGLYDPSTGERLPLSPESEDRTFDLRPFGQG